MFGKWAFSCFLLSAVAGCSAATEYNTGTVVLDISDARITNSDTQTTSEFVSAYEAIKGENYTRAEALLEAALQQKPKDPYALLAMGSVFERTGRFWTAADLYRSAEKYGREATGPQWTGNTEVKESPLITVSDVARENLAKLQEQAAIKP